MATAMQLFTQNFGKYTLYIPLLLIAVLLLATQVNFLLFHTLVEFIAIIIAILFSVVAWQMYTYTKNHYLMFLGIAYFWVAILDLVHTLSYQGLDIIKLHGVNTAVQYWLGARAMEAIAWLVAPYFLTHKLKTRLATGVFAAFTTLIIVLVVYRIFPLGFVSGKGLTNFKIISEYGIIAVLLFSGYQHRLRRKLLDARIYNLLIWSIGLTIAAEVAFTLYISVYGISNILGHILKMLSFWVLFLAVVRTHLTDPFSALSKAETHYDAVPDAIIIVDKRGTIVHVNHSACRLAEKSTSELIGLNHHDVFHSDQYNPVSSCPVCQSVSTGVVLNDHELQVNDDIWYAISTSTIEDGKSYIEVIRNISEKKRIKNLLEKSQEVANMGSWEFDLRRGELLWSRETYRLFGVEYGTPLSYELFLDLVHPEDRELVNDRYMSSVNNNQSGYEVYHRIINKKTGEISYLFEKCMHSKDLQGNIIRSTGITHDITRLELAQQNIRQKELEQKLILDSLVEPIITIDSKGIVQFFNQSAMELFGFSKEEVVGKNVTMLMPDRYAKKHDQYIENYLQTGKAKIIGKGREIEILTKSGNTVQAHLSVSQLRHNENSSPIFIGSIMDLTESRKKDEQIRRRSKLDALGKLTGGIAHDYNNMLGVIKGFVEILKKEIDASSKPFKYLLSIDKAASRGASLTRKLLSFTKNSASELNVAQLGELIQNEAMMLEKTLTPSVDIAYELDSDLWKASVDVNEFVDVLLNLCINAKHAMNGIGKIKIDAYNRTITAEESDSETPAGDYVCVAVSDRGHGMSEDTIQKIFDPFYSTKGELGTGLGLTQVYSFMKRCGGHIEVRSRPGEGATFTLYFPRCDIEEQTSEKTSTESYESLTFPGAKVLVVDDEESMAMYTYEILVRNGYEANVVHDASTAIKQLDETPYDLVISDVIMPEISGLELKLYVNEHFPAIPVLLISGYNEELQGSGNSAEFLQKPFHSNLLLDKIYVALLHNSNKKATSGSQTL